MGTEALWIPLLTAVAGSVVSSALAPKPQKQAAPAAPAAPPQASAAPLAKTYAAANANQAIAGGNASTLLTGTTGVGETNLGKNTLLGD